MLSIVLRTTEPGKGSNAGAVLPGLSLVLACRTTMILPAGYETLAGTDSGRRNRHRINSIKWVLGDDPEATFLLGRPDAHHASFSSSTTIFRKLVSLASWVYIAASTTRRRRR
jgi:hypothetical protein